MRTAEDRELVEVRLRCLACDTPFVAFVFEGEYDEPCPFCGAEEFKRAKPKERVQ